MASKFLSILTKWFALSTNSKEDIPHLKRSIIATNHEISRLYQLPTELIMEIDVHLMEPERPGPHVAQMAFRATCRRFYEILPRGLTKNVKWTEWDRRAYRLLLRQANFRALCGKEREGLLSDKRLVCCICRSAHARDVFTEAAVKKEPELRACIGASGVVELCPHFRITYAGMKLRPNNIVCSRYHHAIGGYEGLVRVNQVGELRASEFMCEVEIPVLEIRGNKKENKQGEGPLGRTKVINAVKETNWKLCPHMHTDSVEEWLPRKSFENRQKRWQVHCCAVKDCDTRFTFMRKEVTRVPREGEKIVKEFVVLRIERYFGSLRGADDKRWMSQIVWASSLLEDRWTWRKEE
ncbi:hypothetical protein CC78DRAFT_529945 [Lojkania enalia]|uniref:F-box domain-containing protein n=1 Tax=Lojkania enalia TaxID=147567 RepID=A0A9P4KGZ5_9PLEO|nr:hypothetical protein CC78DRAFT_529945 [Didymosphaeria enalia]